MAKIVESIRPGDRVTIVDRFGKQRTGRAVMRGSHGGWVLNMGGKHGTPGIASDENITRVQPTRRAGAKGGLGSSAAAHTTKASEASRDIEQAAALTVNKARNGRCTAATMAYADMQRAIGHYEAHVRSGGKAWKPATSIQEAALEYNDRCVRDDSTQGDLRGVRRRKRRR